MGACETDEIIAGNIQTAIFTSQDNGFQASKWFVTYHIRANETFETCFLKLKALYNECEKYIFSEEYGKSGETPHIQGAFILSKRMRASTLQSNFFSNGVTLRKLKNWNSAFNYCVKEGNRIETNCKIPEKVRTIDPTYDWELEILDILEKPIDDRKIFWYWGKGGLGKTAFCKYLTVYHDAICVGGKGSDMRNAIIEYIKKNKTTPKLVLINIPRSFNTDYFSYEGMENIKDMYFYSGKYEGGMVCGNPPNLFIFANVKPEMDKLSKDRWVVKHIEEDYSSCQDM